MNPDMHDQSHVGSTPAKGYSDTIPVADSMCSTLVPAQQR